MNIKEASRRPWTPFIPFIIVVVFGSPSIYILDMFYDLDASSYAGLIGIGFGVIWIVIGFIIQIYVENKP